MKQRQTQISTQAAADLVEESVGGRAGTEPPSHRGERARRAPTQTSLIVEPEDWTSSTDDHRSSAAVCLDWRERRKSPGG
jgi:hypothetical protein